MSRVALSSLMAFAAVAVAQSSFDPTGTEPLTDKHFSYPTGIVRGFQHAHASTL